jgi:class I fructose-bisphosphate aldolase
VKLPTEHIEQEAARKVYETEKVPIATLADRVKHVVQCTFNGRRIVIFSGGAAVSDETVYQEVTAIHQGGGFGSIIGRNSFQRKKEQALQFLGKIISIYAN